MKNSKSLKAWAVLVCLLFLIFPRAVYAYIDPGTGSYILQLIIATLLGVTFTIKAYWKSIKTFLGNILRKHIEDEKE
jgi:hypothetical protein